MSHARRSSPPPLHAAPASSEAPNGRQPETGGFESPDPVRSPSGRGVVAENVPDSLIERANVQTGLQGQGEILDRKSEAAATSPTDPAGDGAVSPVACACGAERAAGGERCARGHVGPANSLAMQHGLRAAGEVARELEAGREAFLAAAIADDGGEAEVPTRRRSLLVYRSRLDLHITQLSTALTQFGLFDRRGRLRAVWLQRLESAIGQARAIDATLGLTRGSKPVESAADIVAEYRREGQPS